MHSDRNDSPTNTPASKGRQFLLWLLFAVFVAGGLYAGGLALSTDLGAAAGIPQRLAPFNVGNFGNTANPGNTEDSAPALDWLNQERVNILLLGGDRRPADDESEPMRTDTMMVVSLDPYTKTAAMFSIPRDTWVPISLGNGQVLEERINTAYVYGEVGEYPGGGRALAKDTVQYNFGIPIHFAVLVDFKGFERMIDTLGGVTVNLPEPLIDNAYPTDDYEYMQIYIPEGVQTLDGRRALWYVRSRHQDSDLGRIQRQQQMLLAVREKALQLDMLPKLPQLWEEFRDSVETDLPYPAIVGLAQIAREVKPEDIVRATLDADEGYVTEATTFDGAEILVPNRSQIRKLVNQVFFDARRDQENARIEVLNGTNTPGLATKTAKLLEDFGFGTVTVGDAQDGLHDTTQVFNLSGKSYTATQVANVLQLSIDRVQSAELAEGEAVDVRVVLGSDAPLLP